MEEMKNVQISQELFMQLLRFHLLDDQTPVLDIRRALDARLNKLMEHDLYTQYKNGATDQEREEARMKYLEQKGVPEEFRW